MLTYSTIVPATIGDLQVDCVVDHVTTFASQVTEHPIENGFVIEGNYNNNDYRIQRQTKTLYTLHNEFAFKKLGKIDCFDVSIKDDSFYCIPSQKDVVTKLMLATEEMYKIVTEKKMTTV